MSAEYRRGVPPLRDVAAHAAGGTPGLWAFCDGDPEGTPPPRVSLVWLGVSDGRVREFDWCDGAWYPTAEWRDAYLTSVDAVTWSHPCDRGGAPAPRAWEPVVGPTDALADPVIRAAFEEETLLLEFATQLDVRVERAGLSRAQVAERAGVAADHLDRALRGEDPLLLASAARLALAVGARVSLRLVEDEP